MERFLNLNGAVLLNLNGAVLNGVIPGAGCDACGAFPSAQTAEAEYARSRSLSYGLASS